MLGPKPAEILASANAVADSTVHLFADAMFQFTHSHPWILAGERYSSLARIAAAESPFAQLNRKTLRWEEVRPYVSLKKARSEHDLAFWAK